MISLTDLMIMCDLIEFPSQLIAYIEKRIAILKSGSCTSQDELDFLGFFLETGSLPLGSGPVVSLGSFTDTIDAYYSSRAGIRRSSVKAPSQQLVNRVRKLVEAVDDSEFYGRTEVAAKLITLDKRSQQSLAKNMLRAERKSKRSHQSVAFSLVTEECGVSYVSGGDNIEALSKLENVSNRDRAKSGKSIWVGVAESSLRKRTLFGIVFAGKTWLGKDLRL